MNRRSFCKIAAASALVAALAPSRLLAAHSLKPAQRAGGQVSVLRCECVYDLQAPFCTDPEAGRCPMLSPGMSWSVRSWSGEAPAGMCPKAWKAICSAVSGADSACSAGGDVIAACPDGMRPVIFRIQLK